MKEEPKNTTTPAEELMEFGDSFVKYSRKNNSWIYLFLILIILFGAVYFYKVAYRQSDEATRLVNMEDFQELQDTVKQQEQRIQDLEEQIKLLSKQNK